MPTSYSTLLGLALPVTGELSGTWGDEVNNYITQYLDSAVAGTQTISGSQTAVTLSRTTNAALSQAGSGSTGSSQYQVINCTGNPASALTVTVPSTSKVYLVLNNTSTSQTVTVKGAATTGVTVAAARCALIAWNGTDFELVATDDASKMNGVLAAANGGTGQSSYTTGDILFASGSTTLSKLADVATGNALISGGVGVAPSYGKIGLTTHVSGTLPIANGGTNGTATPTAGTIAYGTGTAYAFNTAGTSGQPLLSGGSGAPTFGTLSVAAGGTGQTSYTNGQLLIGNTTGNTLAKATLTAGSGVTITNGAGAITISATGSGGTVTSVGATAPVASSGGNTPTISLNSAYGDTLNPYGSKTANFFLAAPNGTAGVPSFRAVVAADIPTLNQNTTGTAANITASSNSTLTTLSSLSLPGSQVSGNISGSAGNVTGTVAVANGGTGSTTAAGARTNLGATTLGGNLFIITNPSAITFPRFNADNTVSALDAATFRTAIGAGTGGGSVTSVSGTGTVNGITLSGTVTSSGSLTLGGTLSGVSLTTQVTGTLPLANGGTGQTSAQAAINSLAGAVTSGQYLRGNGTNVVMSAIQAADVPTLNQNTTGTASNVTGTVAVANGGTGSTTAGGARTNLGATTVGANFFTLTNPTAVTFPRINADNTVSALDAATFRSAIGAGTGSGTVTSVATSGSVNGITLTGGTITSTGTITLGGTLSGVSLTTQVTGTLPVANGGTGVTSSTGSGSVVLSTSPSLTTPALGTPSSGNLTNTTVDGTNKVGYRNLPPVGTKTGSYTLAVGDVGKYVQVSTGGSITIPTSTFAEGDAITLFNNTTGNITITCSAPTAYIAGTNTVKTSMTLATRGVATVLFISATLCVVTGNVT
jgi:hypothetical protein